MDDTIFVWPDGGWCAHDGLEDRLTWCSDDYAQIRCAESDEANDINAADHARGTLSSDWYAQSRGMTGVAPRR